MLLVVHSATEKLTRILACVLFPLLGAQELTQVVAPSNLLSKDQLVRLYMWLGSNAPLDERPAIEFNTKSRVVSHLTACLLLADLVLRACDCSSQLFLANLTCSLFLPPRAHSGWARLLASGRDVQEPRDSAGDGRAESRVPRQRTQTRRHFRSALASALFWLTVLFCALCSGGKEMSRGKHAWRVHILALSGPVSRSHLPIKRPLSVCALHRN